MATRIWPVMPEQTGLWQVIWAASRPSRLARGVELLAVASGVATYATVTGLVPYHPTSAALIALLLINLALVLALGALIAWRLTRFWVERRSGSAGARLHVRLVAIFSAIAVVPAILVAIFAAVTLNLGVEAWFSAHVKVGARQVRSTSPIAMCDEKRGPDRQRRAARSPTDIQRDPQLFDAHGNADVRADCCSRAADAHQGPRPAGGLYSRLARARCWAAPNSVRCPISQPPTAGDIAQAARGPVLIDANSKIGVVRALIAACRR